MLGYKRQPGHKRWTRGPKNEASKHVSIRSIGLESPPTHCRPGKPPRAKKSQLANAQPRKPRARSSSCPTPCTTANPKSDAADSSISRDGDEADGAEAVDKFALQRIAVFAYFYLCAVTLWKGRSILSLSDDEIQKAIDETFCYFFCPRSQGPADAPVDAGAGAGASAGAGAGGTGGQLHGNSSSAPGGYSSVPNLNSQGKRGLGPGDDDPNDDRGKRQRTDGNPLAKVELVAERLWACPFFCHDSEMHRECLQFKMKRIVDVRTHVKRVHTQKPFCVDCGFPFEGLKDPERQRHIRARACVPVDNPGERFPGASPDMLDMMTRRANDAAAPTQKEKWYVIWDILFPGQRQPLDPYAPISEVAYAIPGYVSEFVEENTQQLQQTARQVLVGIPHDFADVTSDERDLLHRFSQFVQRRERAREQAREQQRERSGRRNRASLPSQPSDTPSLVGSSQQGTFTNQTRSARTPGQTSEFVVPPPPAHRAGFNGTAIQGPPMVPHYTHPAAAAVPAAVPNQLPTPDPNAAGGVMPTPAYHQAPPVLWNPTFPPSFVFGPGFDFELFFPGDGKNVSNQPGYYPQ